MAINCELQDAIHICHILSMIVEASTEANREIRMDSTIKVNYCTSFSDNSGQDGVARIIMHLPKVCSYITLHCRGTGHF